MTMKLYVKIAKAGTLKRAVEAMKDVTTSGLMQMKSHSLVFGVEHNVSVVLRLTEFKRYGLNDPLLQNAAVEIDLQILHEILNCFCFDKPLTFFIRKSKPEQICFRLWPGSAGELSLRTSKPIHRIPKYMGDLFRAFRPFKFALQARLLHEPLVDCLHNGFPLTVIGWRHVVMIGARYQPGYYCYINYYNQTNPNPDGSYCRFHLSLQLAIYIFKACQRNPWICFHTQDPSVDPKLPFAISFPLDDNTHLVFYLLFNSTVEPRVHASTCRIPYGFPRHHLVLNQGVRLSPAQIMNLIS